MNRPTNRDARHDFARPPTRAAVGAVSGWCAAFTGNHGALAILVVVLWATAADGDPGWKRSRLTALPDQSCQELVVRARGAGPLEVRFPLVPLAEIGPDDRRSGASLWLPADPTLPFTVSSLHSSVLPTLAYRADDPLRWIRDGNRLCFASGLEPVACVRTRLPVVGSQRIAFGAGWETRLDGCADFYPPTRWDPWVWGLGLLTVLTAARTIWKRRQRGTLLLLLALAPCMVFAGAGLIPSFWIDPHFSGFGGALSLAIGLLALARGRPDVTLVAVCLLAWLSAPIALRPATLEGPRAPAPAEVPAAAALWVDPAYWNPYAAIHSLRFRNHSVAEALEGAQETWVVLGGSVTYGTDVENEQTFVALAERELRDSGRSIRLLNAGVPAWTLGHADRQLRELDDDLDLDGVVVISILNNAGFRLPGPRPTGCDGAMLPALLCNLARGPAHLSVVKYFLPKPGNREHYRATLRELLERETGLGRQVVLMDETSRWQVENRREDARDESYRAIAREEARRSGLTLHDVSRAVVAVPESERFLDAIHLAPAGHRAVGARLAAILEREALSTDRSGDGGGRP